MIEIQLTWPEQSQNKLWFYTSIHKKYIEIVAIMTKIETCSNFKVLRGCDVNFV